MDNNINFRGAFIIKMPNENLVNKMKNALGKGTLVYEIAGKPTDILYVTRKSNDSIAANIIKEKALKFRYYPELGTTSGFIPNNPLQAFELVKTSGKKYIRTLTKMFETIRKGKTEICTPSEQERYPHLAKTMEILGFNTPDYKAVNKNGMHIILNKEGKIVAQVSAPNACKRHYVHITPVIKDLPTRRIEIDKDGNVFDFGINGINQFMKSFNAAKKYGSKKIK